MSDPDQEIESEAASVWLLAIICAIAGTFIILASPGSVSVTDFLLTPIACGIAGWIFGFFLYLVKKYELERSHGRKLPNYLFMSQNQYEKIVERKRQAEEKKRQAEEKKRLADEEERRAEIRKYQVEEEKHQAEEEKRQAKEKPAKLKAFQRKNFQSGHSLPTNSQKEKAWLGHCRICEVSSITRETSFWWRIYPKLEVVLLCDKCAEKEGLVEEKETEDEKRSRRISESVKDAVWRRDEGRCVECGSNEDLEFDHIIPHSRGGSNNKRNIQLLCESCNRKKSDNIG